MAFYRNVSTLFDDIEIPYQECSECGVEKSLSQFNLRDKHQRIDTRCKDCKATLYNLAKTLRNQNYSLNEGVCHGCGVYKGKRKLRCDHDHDTNEFRGWLCENCNTGIGRLGDNIEGLQKALDYLLRFEQNKKQQKGTLF